MKAVTAALPTERLDGELPLRAEYFPQGRSLWIATNHFAVLRQAEQLWGRYPRLSRADPVCLDISVSARYSPGDPIAPTCRVRGHRILFQADRFNRAVADLQRGAGRAIFTPDYLSDIEQWRYHFLEPLGYVLIAARHFTLLHAASIARNGRAVLLCGDSGAGKTCLAYAAARKRWSFLSGDATALIRGAPTPRIVGRPFEIRLRHTAPSLFPELRRFTPVLRPNGKLDIELDPETLGLPTALEASAACVVILQRENVCGASVEPLPRDECRRRVQSSICFGDAALRQEQMQALESLLDVPLFRLRYGTLDSAEQALCSLLESDRRGGVA